MTALKYFQNMLGIGKQSKT